ncbi:unnamed protein product [Acanthoscelides obtectus]|uniref:Uncharacterized protein n=1 Tax=Acanthoscelides obtectus TaxID=200917 RepID=A0A9P0MFD6_ACAOB|nr:unnamed protein product [Acanthoscelides obtectus]CAK1627231.1 hypothetical protein AOBTE_LOCUS4415 [Acanthoscelides obtectus]
MTYYSYFDPILEICKLAQIDRSSLQCFFENGFVKYYALHKLAPPRKTLRGSSYLNRPIQLRFAYFTFSFCTILELFKSWLPEKICSSSCFRKFWR